MRANRILGFVCLAIASLVLVVSLQGCGGPVGDDTIQSNDSAFWTGSARLEGDYTCSDGNWWHIVQPVTQSYQRLAGGVPSRYVVKMIDDGQPWPIDYGRNIIQIGCSFVVPVSPTCGANGALCSTGGATCGVYTMWGGTRQWHYSGYVSVPGLTYYPDVSPKGNYIMSLSQVAFGSGDGLGITGCTSPSTGRVPYSFWQ